MKRFLIISLIMISLISSKAMAQNTEQVLGAIAGGALGSTVGDGDGKKAATVIGAIIGYRMGERILNPKDRNNFLSMNHSDFVEYCQYDVPSRYYGNDNLERQWVRGCVERLRKKQRELEREAYRDGLNGY